MKGDGVREIGRRKGDVWDRFDRLQRNLLAFSRGKGKRRTVQRFRTYQDLSGGRDQRVRSRVLIDKGAIPIRDYKSEELTGSEASGRIFPKSAGKA